jgi:hypothetical protein
MKSVKKQVIDVNEGYRKNILGCFNDYRDFLLCINRLQDPSNRIQFSPYRPSYVTPGSIEEWTYFKLLRTVIWKANQ